MLNVIKFYFKQHNARTTVCFKHKPLKQFYQNRSKHKIQTFSSIYICSNFLQRSFVIINLTYLTQPVLQLLPSPPPLIYQEDPNFDLHLSKLLTSPSVVAEIHLLNCLSVHCHLFKYKKGINLNLDTASKLHGKTITTTTKIISKYLCLVVVIFSD